MTNLEQATRAEAERRYPPVRTPGGYTAPLSLQADKTFVAGASWLAEHLLSDESVERAAEAMWDRWGAKGMFKHAPIHRQNSFRTDARAALTAALGTNHNGQEQR